MITRAIATPSSSPPAKCPQCAGRDLTTASKVIDASTYWRCLSCGEIWKILHRDLDSRFGFRR